MTSVSRIHKDKQPKRTHFIREWAEKRGLSQADVARQMDVERSTVKRWFDGAIPTKRDHFDKLLGVLSLEDVSSLFRDPDDDWFAQFFKNRSQEERERMIKTLEAAFPTAEKDGTKG